MFRIADCPQSAILAGAVRPCWCSFHAQPASGHHDAAHMRRSQPRPCLGRARALPGCPRAETEFRVGRKRTCSMHAHPPRTPKTERPRVLRPEGVRVSSGDRGGRSPWESAGCQDSSSRARRSRRMPKAYARRCRPQREGCSARRWAMSYAGVMVEVVYAMRPVAEGRARYAARSMHATSFFARMRRADEW